MLQQLVSLVKEVHLFHSIMFNAMEEKLSLQIVDCKLAQDFVPPLIRLECGVSREQVCLCSKIIMLA